MQHPPTPPAELKRNDCYELVLLLILLSLILW
jgi:hypothetical protein